MSCNHLNDCPRCAAELAEAELNIESLAAANAALREIGEYLHREGDDLLNEEARKDALESYFKLFDMLNDA